MRNVGPVWVSERRPWGRGDVVALLAWTAALAASFRDAVFLRGACSTSTSPRSTTPTATSSPASCAAGRFSRWCPDLYCGMPLYSESQAGYLHPLKYLLYPWMPTWQALNLDTVLSVWLAGLGAYGWLRRHVGAVGALDRRGGLRPGRVHLGPPGPHEHGSTPWRASRWSLWALEVAWERRPAAGRRAGGAGAGLPGLRRAPPGHPPDGPGGRPVRRSTARRPKRPGASGRRALGTAVGMVALGVVLSAVQWVPSKELLDRSPRAGGLTWEELTYGSWSPELLPTLARPRGLRHARPRHRLDGRLLPLP